MKTRMALLLAAVALAAWLRPPAREERPAAVAAGDPEIGRERAAEERPRPGLPAGEAVEARAELDALQARRELEWGVDVDPQTRLEWTERYDAERTALLERLEAASGKP